ncbi:class I SAM-dependent methyltransferase [Litorimonas haliclonae]|uniref:class I SAM-dependent methyltransferase n=1 Tax=Litorimonas haliclonae TaxID=2081977 RepID=UPI0039F07820
MATHEKKTKDRNKEIFDSRSSHYAEDINDSVAFSGLKADFFTRVKAEYFRDHLTEKFGGTTKLNVLDLGCGIGIFEGLFENDFDAITGIDVSELSIETAKANQKHACFHLYEGSQIPFEDDHFDVVFTICVMHHVPPENWEKFVAEAHRVLKPGGVFAVFEHNPYNPLTLKVVNDCILDEDAVLLKPKKLNQVIKTAFSKPTRTEFIIAIPPLNKFFKFFDRLLKRLPFGAQYAVYVEK